MTLFEAFRLFYVEVSRLAARAAEGSWTFDQTAGAAGEIVDVSPIGIHRKLLRALERPGGGAIRPADVGAATFERAQYAMAALADEIFLNAEWGGRDVWRDQLLEAHLFNSRRAGQELFERIDQLLHGALGDQEELARIYLTVLALGFKGKFRGDPSADVKIGDYCARLYRYLRQRDPLVIEGESRLAPQAYETTLTTSRPARLPYVKRWLWALSMLFMVWLLGSFAVWRYETKDLRRVVDEMRTMGGLHEGIGRGPG
jgi:type VI secretion system protein ImpK